MHSSQCQFCAVQGSAEPIKITQMYLSESRNCNLCGFISFGKIYKIVCTRILFVCRLFTNKNKYVHTRICIYNVHIYCTCVTRSLKSFIQAAGVRKQYFLFSKYQDSIKIFSKMSIFRHAPLPTSTTGSVTKNQWGEGRERRMGA